MSTGGPSSPEYSQVGSPTNQQADARKRASISDWRSEATAHQYRRQDVVKQRTEDERLRAQQENMEISDKIIQRRSMRSSIAKASSLPGEFLDANPEGRRGSKGSQIDHTEGINSMFPASKLVGSFSERNEKPASKVVHRRTVGGTSFAGKRISTMDDRNLSVNQWKSSRMSLRGSRTSSIEADSDGEHGRPGSKNTFSRLQSLEEDSDNQTQRKVDKILELSRKHGLTVSTLQEAWKEFERYDRDGSGQLSTHEFNEQLKSKLKLKAGQEMPKHLAMSTWLDADQDGNGALDFEEYLLWRQRHNFAEEIILDDPMQKRIRELAREHGLPIVEVEDTCKIFERFDEDRSGVIEKSEFKRLLVALLKGKSLSDMPEKRLDRYWNEIDVDQSGTVTLDEFVLWYMKYFRVDDNDNDDPCRVVTQAYASLAVNRFRPLAHCD
jgi:Ca2+-binding EF-hand superfamily protein